jgi:hypothetical protein
VPPLAISSSVTPQDVTAAVGKAGAADRDRDVLESLAGAMATFTSAGYGQQPARDRTALDTALGTGRDAIRRLRVERLDPRTYLRRLRVRAPEVEQQT